MYLASLRKDGAPFVVPIGFDWDGESFFITIALDHAGRAPPPPRSRVSLSVGSHPAFPTKFVVVEGVAEEVADPGAAISRRILFRKSQEMFARMRVDPGALLRELDLGRPGRVPRPGHVARELRRHEGEGAKYSAGTRLPTDSTRALPGTANIPRDASSLITRSP